MTAAITSTTTTHPVPSLSSGDEPPTPTEPQVVSRLAQRLRQAGACGIVVAMGLYLLDGVSAQSDLQRSLLALGFTALLGSLGLLMVRGFDEPRGARVFFSLALASVPLNAAVFGALLYSVIPLDSVVVTYQDYAHWTVGETGGLLLTSLVSAIVLPAASWFGFSILARRSRAHLTVTFLVCCALLLVPGRNELWTAGLGLSCLFCSAFVLKQRHAQDPTLATLEGHIASAIVLIPLAVIVGRGLLVYQVDGFAALALLLATQFALRQLTTNGQATGWWVTLGHLVSAVIALLAATCVFGAMLDIIDSPSVALAGFQIVFAALLLELERRMTSMTLRRPIRVMGAMLMLLVALAGSIVLSAPGSIVVSTLTAAGVLAYGLRLRESLETGFAALTLAALLLINGQQLVTVAIGTGWFGIAAVGVVAILLGSLLERRHRQQPVATPAVIRMDDTAPRDAMGCR